MDEAARREFLSMVASYQNRGDPTGWFDKVYRDAQGDFRGVFWADLAPNPYLVSWLEEHPVSGENLWAVVVGCGVGDDAEAISAHGYQVIAFDISPAAIDLCRKRYPNTHVEYRVADLFDHPKDWAQRFDLVYECNTIQVLPGDYRIRALNAIADLVAPGGNALVSCRSRKTGEKENEFPLPLDRPEIDGFVRAGLKEESFVVYDDDQAPPVPHFFGCYTRPLKSV
ncbi:class I SAM-dependent methyltransferase [Sulfurirhabdus autotrophica]|uniref:Methyltransferase family protein n=1 Tax=Sulfurirhabdus autotrophica TaxID=1706046 RepID=A0A4R3XWL7_9PROT|nr:class I SAM-dependent methyltransferase [Sulfurirhabdus autotrophica]TCV84135.1 methyltransferase family protein [Sulfurirhabdus autotrophica]